jgi:hypothetical protein
MAAGILFVVIQPIHPPDSLASVTTGAWSAIHEATLLMTVLFLAGITGIYARQVEQSGWLGLAGYVAVSLGLMITAGFVFIEAFVEPLMASSSPAFVSSVLAMVEGTPTQVDLGVLTTVWSASGALFLGGCIVFGIATIRADVLSRAAAVVFAFGFLASAPISISLDAPRLTAVPIGVGLAWLGYALCSQASAPAASPQNTAIARPQSTSAA